MDKNKSIDGLSSRRSKTAATSVKSPKPTPKKPIKTTTKTTTKKTTTKTTKTVTKPAPKKTQSVPVTTPKPATISSSTDDFLKPVQAFNFDEDSGELKASTTPISKGKTMKKDKKPVNKKRKIITRIIIGILSLLFIVGLIFIIWGNDIIAKITGGQGNVFDLIFQDETYEPLKTDENGRTNILAIGTSGFNMNGDEGDGTHDGAQLTDSIMVISLNQETGDVAMLSLPRDLKASPTCTATGKINEVYWCNGGGGDISLEEEAAANQALMDEVGSILGIDFQYFAHLNWGSLVSIVNILEGITVTLDEDIEDYYYTGAIFQAGIPYTIDGGQALGLARARHGTSGGDFSRGASQQKILIGIKDKIAEKSLSLSDLLSLANTLGDNLRTSFSLDEIRTLGHLFSEFDFNNMRQVSLIEPERLMTTGEINGISYVLPSAGVNNYGAIKKYVAKMFSNYPQVYEDYTILVLNGTDTTGLATTEQTSLEDAHFQNITINNAPAGEYPDDYTLYAITDTAPGTKKALEDKYHTTAKSAEELPAGIPTDYDFILILGDTPSTTE